jgi:hypothetical protein
MEVNSSVIASCQLGSVRAPRYVFGKGERAEA